MMLDRLSGWFQRASTAVLDTLAPPLCVACDVMLVHHDSPLCQACMELVQPPPRVICHHCGVGVSRHADDLPYHGDLCERCIHFPPRFEMARAAFDYEGLLGEIIPAIKYGRREVLMHHLSALFVPFGTAQVEAWFEAERRESKLVLTPMPMHWRAVSKRGFSQTMILTAALAAHTSTWAHFAPHAIAKRMHTSQQAGLSLAARRTNLVGAFKADPKVVRGRAVVLVDDVMTSGSSADEAAHACLEAGAKRVFVLTLARATP